MIQSRRLKQTGQRGEAMDGLIINGRFVPGRSCNSIYGTRSPSKMATVLPEALIEPHYDLGKHLYWRALNEGGSEKAKRLELQTKEYPKP